MTSEPILDDKQTAVHRLYWIEKKSTDEIAALMGCSRRTAKRHVDELRMIYRTFGIELACYNLGQREAMTAKAGKIEVT